MTVEVHVKQHYNVKRRDRSARESGEHRLELIKRVGNLRLKYLQRLYDGRSIGERYRSGEAVLHLHCVCREDIRTLVCFRIYAAKFCRETGRDRHYVPMLVIVRDLSQSLRPVASFIGLQPLEVCDVAEFHPSKIGLTVPVEILWKIIDRKLCTAMARPRIDEPNFNGDVVQARTELLGKFTDEDISPRVVRSWLAFRGEAESCALTLDGNKVNIRFPEIFYSLFEIREVFPCPL